MREEKWRRIKCLVEMNDELLVGEDSINIYAC